MADILLLFTRLIIEIMKKFKFEIGQIVKHATSGRIDYNMIVLARMLEESGAGVEEKYLVSINNMGSIQRHMLSVTELMEID